MSCVEPVLSHPLTQLLSGQAWLLLYRAISAPKCVQYYLILELLSRFLRFYPEEFGILNQSYKDARKTYRF